METLAYGINVINYANIESCKYYQCISQQCIHNFMFIFSEGIKEYAVLKI